MLCAADKVINRQLSAGFTGVDMSNSHRAPSLLIQTVWRLSHLHQVPVPEVALMLAMPPTRVERILDAMHKRRVARWRMI